MAIFQRLATLLRSNVNHMINEAEDPEKMLTQMLMDMQEQLMEAKKQVAVSIADEKKLEKQFPGSFGPGCTRREAPVRYGRDSALLGNTRPPGVTPVWQTHVDPLASPAHMRTLGS